MDLLFPVILLILVILIIVWVLAGGQQSESTQKDSNPRRQDAPPQQSQKTSTTASQIRPVPQSVSVPKWAIPEPRSVVRSTPPATVVVPRQPVPPSQVTPTPRRVGTTRKIPDRKQQDLGAGRDVQNDVLWRAIFDRYTSIAAFCTEASDRHGIVIDDGMVRRLLHGTLSPILKGRSRGNSAFKKGQYRPICIVLSEVLRVPIEELFPRYAYREDPRGPREFVFSQLPAQDVHAAHVRSTSKRSPLDTIVHEEERQRLDKLLSMLNPLNEYILRIRFEMEKEGAHPTKKRTYKQIGERVNLSRERVRQRENEALQQLRNILECEEDSK